MTSELSAFATRLREMIPEAIGLEAQFNSLALELFALQFDLNFAYRKICEAHGATPGTVKHWSQIPSVPTSAFKELDLTCLSLGEHTHVFHSSGTTEQRPSRHFHSADSLALYETSLLSAFPFSAADCGQILFLTPPPATAPNSSLVHMFDTLRRRSAAPDSAFVGRLDEGGAWTVDFDAALSVITNASEPVFVFGTAFSFVHLLDFLSERNLRLQLPSGSRVLETGGYKGRSRSLSKSELHRLITNKLGVPAPHILCEYGMSELSSQAYAAGATGCFQFPSWARVQIISPETSREVREDEIGLIRVFDLANAFSVCAVQTEDLAIRRGAGFELIGRAALTEPRGCSLMAV